MQEQQIAQLYSPRTQNQAKENHKHLEELVILDIQDYANFIAKQTQFSDTIILDTSIFMPTSIENLIYFSNSKPQEVLGESINKIFSKSSEYFNCLKLILTNNKNLYVTKEVVQEIDWGLVYFRNLLNPKRLSYAQRANKRLFEYRGIRRILELIQNNKELYNNLLKKGIRDSVNATSDLRGFLLDNHRVLNPVDNMDKDFRILLKNSISSAKNPKRQISPNDQAIFYTLFLNVFNHSTGIITRDQDFYIMAKKVKTDLINLNHRSEKYDFVIKNHNYPSHKLYTYVLHINKV